METRSRLRTITAALLAFFAVPGIARAESIALPAPQYIFGFAVTHSVVIMSAVVAVLIYICCRIALRNISKDNPGRGQVVLELILSAFNSLCKQSIGPNRGPKYLPYIGTLFLFIWTANLIALIPVPAFTIGGDAYEDFNGNGQWDPGEPFIDAEGNIVRELGAGAPRPGFQVPAFIEPTANLNVPLSMAILFITFIGHGSCLFLRGFLGYLKSYFEPPGVVGICMFPLTVISRISEHISISFRLFGNLFGGLVIMSVVTGLLHHIILPIGMYGYFVVFVGTVQAFVFTMLALTYISMQVGESTE